MEAAEGNRLRLNLSTTAKGAITWDLTVEVHDPDEDAAYWTDRRRVAVRQAELLVSELRTRYGQGELLGPDMTEIIAVATTRAKSEAAK